MNTVRRYGFQFEIFEKNIKFLIFNVGEVSFPMRGELAAFTDNGTEDGSDGAVKSEILDGTGNLRNRDPYRIPQCVVAIAET